MSVIDDLGQLLQDLVTPEFRALSVRVDALEKKVDTLDRKVDTGFIALEKKVDAGFTKADVDLKQAMADTEARAERRHTALIIALQLEERVKRLEQDRIASHEQRT
jgi:translation initiation factor 2 gamma subunit (eIF-2gamma)